MGNAMFSPLLFVQFAYSSCALVTLVLALSYVRTFELNYIHYIVFNELTSIYINYCIGQLC